MHRRRLLAGFAASLAGSAHGAPEPASARLFTSGPLATNEVAAGFERAPPHLFLPPLTLLGDDGRPHRFSELRGRPVLVSLWSEYCAPCLAEAADLAALRQRHTNVHVIAILTDSEAKLSPEQARAHLDGVGAAALPTWVEAQGGDLLIKLLASSPQFPQGSLPCNLLVDEAERVRGRMFGARFESTPPLEQDSAGRLTAKGKAQMLSAHLHSVWATANADTLLDRIAAGALRREPT